MRKREKGRTQLRELAIEWSERLKIRPRVIRVQQMRRKWGSCSTSGIVSLAADLANHDRGFQDFVIAHELLHLRLPNHGKVFKAMMSIHVPRWREYEKQVHHRNPTSSPTRR